MITIKTIASSSKGNAYLLESGGRRLLLECGISFKRLQRALGYQVATLDGCLVTHAHNDHACAMRDLVNFAVDVYSHRETFEWQAVKPDNICVFPVCHAAPFTVGPGDYWYILPFEGRHDVPVFGYQISDGEDVLVFMTDSGYCKYTFEGMTVLMIEANFSEEILQKNVEDGRIDSIRAKRVFQNHMSIERVVDMLKSNDLSKLKEIRLLHLSDGNSDEVMFKRMVQEVAGVPVIVEEA